MHPVLSRLDASIIAGSCRRRSHVPTADLCPSNGNSPLIDQIPLRNERKRTVRKISTSCSESTRSGVEYVTRFGHPRLSTPTVSYELAASPPANTHQRQAISQRTTKMLVICSTAFLIFNSPYCAVLFYSVISKHVLTRTLDILRHFYFMSFCLNFFLYSLCGNRFRHELVNLLKRICRKCTTPKFRLHFDKIPHQSSLAGRTGV